MACKKRRVGWVVGGVVLGASEARAMRKDSRPPDLPLQGSREGNRGEARMHTRTNKPAGMQRYYTPV